MVVGLRIPIYFSRKNLLLVRCNGLFTQFLWDALLIWTLARFEHIGATGAIYIHHKTCTATLQGRIPARTKRNTSTLHNSDRSAFTTALKFAKSGSIAVQLLCASERLWVTS